MSELAWARPASAARTLPTVAETPFMISAFGGECCKELARMLQYYCQEREGKSMEINEFRLLFTAGQIDTGIDQVRVERATNVYSKPLLLVKGRVVPSPRNLRLRNTRRIISPLCNYRIDYTLMLPFGP